jgi:hypothetical protein
LSDAELTARLAWLAIVPLAIAQMAVAVMIRRRLGLPVLRAAALAAGGSLVAGLLGAALVEDRRSLLAIEAALYFVPGVPPLIALLRQRMWALAVVLFAAPPALVLAFTV